MKDPANKISQVLYTTLEGNVKLSYKEALRYNSRVLKDGGSIEGLSCVYSAIVSLKGSSESGLSVYTFMPNAVNEGYIYIDDFQYNNEDLKDRFMHLGNVNLQVIIPTSDPSASRKVLNDYCEIVLNWIMPLVGSKLDLTPDFNNTYLYSTNVSEFTDNFDDGRTIRRVIRLTLGIEEL